MSSFRANQIKSAATKKTDGKSADHICTPFSRSLLFSRWESKVEVILVIANEKCLETVFLNPTRYAEHIQS